MAESEEENAWDEDMAKDWRLLEDELWARATKWSHRYRGVSLKRFANCQFISHKFCSDLGDKPFQRKKKA